MTRAIRKAYDELQKQYEGRTVVNGVTQDQAAALQGTDGSPSETNRYVTDSDIIASYITKDTLHANTLLKADTDHTPIELTVAASTIVGRGAAGGIEDLSPAQARTVLGLDSTTDGSEGTTLIGDHTGHTLHETLQHILNRSVLDGLVITDAGGRNITWSAGEVYDSVTAKTLEIDAGSGTCTADALNYLIWNAGSTLTLGTTATTGTQVLVGEIACNSSDILDIHQVEYYNTITAAIRRGLRKILPLVVTNGLVVTEDTDATNVWDVACSSGTFIEDATHEETEASTVLSRTTAMRRWYHSGGAWTSDTNAQVDITKYDNMTDLVAVTAAKYHKSLFLILDGVIQWIYPQAEYVTEAQAIAAPLPVIPAALTTHPQLTAVVIRGNAAAFPTAGGQAWIDVRPRLAGNVAGTISDHSSLANLTADDHTQYIMVNGRGHYYSAAALADDATIALPTITANFAAHGNVVVSSSGVINESAEFEIDSTGTCQIIRGTANMVANADTDGKFCLGTAAAENPMSFKNRLAASKNVMITLDYA